MYIRRWRADVNSFPELDSQIQYGATYSFEYDTRTTYGKNITGWDSNDPLNATWWHRVTEVMENDPDLVRVSLIRQLLPIIRVIRSLYLTHILLHLYRHSTSIKGRNRYSLRSVMMNALQRKSVICVVDRRV